MLYEPFGCAKIYADRFGIERVFKEMKSAGFDIESTKVRKLTRMHKMLFLCVVSYVITVLAATFIREQKSHIKKQYPLQNSIAIAYLPLLQGI